MAKKNPAVLWTVDQSLEKGDKEKSRANIGINFNSAADSSGNTLTFVSSIDENATTGDLTYKTKSVTVDQSYSGTSSNPASGKSIKDAIDGLDATNNVTEGHYITAVNETNGIVSLTTAAMDTSPTKNSTKTVSSGGVWDAIDSTEAALRTEIGGKLSAVEAAKGDHYNEYAASGPDIRTSTSVRMDFEKMFEVIIVICSVDNGNAVDLRVNVE